MKTFIISLMALLLGIGTPVAGHAASTAEIRALVEGVYILDEWHADGKVYRPPSVEARFVIQNGAVIAALVNTAEESKKTYSVLFGTYSLTPSSFAYGYQTTAAFTQTQDNISLSRALLFDGKQREFAVMKDGNSVHLKFGDTASFEFNPAGVTYLEGGKVLRVYHRAKPEQD